MLRAVLGIVVGSRLAEPSRRRKARVWAERKWKILMLRRVSLLAACVMMVAGALESCSYLSDERWKTIGVRQVRVGFLECPDSIAANDTLMIHLSGTTEQGNRRTLSRIDAIREKTALELTLWAEVEEWVGSGPMPPCDCDVYVDYQVLPPFTAGSFKIAVNQPDNSQLEDSVVVVPRSNTS